MESIDEMGVVGMTSGATLRVHVNECFASDRHGRFLLYTAPTSSSKSGFDYPMANV